VRGIIIDGYIAWTGGFGIADKWFGDGRTNGSWRETNVRFEGPAGCARPIQATFKLPRPSRPRRRFGCHTASS
jgi:cardiolipin synthase